MCKLLKLGVTGAAIAILYAAIVLSDDCESGVMCIFNNEVSGND